MNPTADEKRQQVRASLGNGIDLETADTAALIEYINKLELNLWDVNAIRRELYDALWKYQNRGDSRTNTDGIT